MEKIIAIPEGYEARIEGNKVVLEPKNEDERIRKEIIVFLTYGIWSEAAIETVKTNQGYAKWIAYLEKQKEQEPSQYDIDILEKHITKDSISELAHTVIIRNGWEIVEKEQKPAEWSKEDEKALSAVISLMISSRAVDPFYDKMCLKDWLNSLPKRFDLQPKQEDRYIEGYQKGFADAEKIYNNGVPYYIGNPNIYKLDPNVVIDSTTGGTYVACHCWKPSEEQMEWLESAVKLSTDKPGIHGIILSLYEQLKRL